MNTQKGVEEKWPKGHGEDQRPCSFPINIIIHRERCDFAKAHEHWTVEDWKRVIWSDGRKWVWKKKGEGLSDRLVQGTLKYGGGHVMLWGCFGWDWAIPAKSMEIWMQTSM